MSLIILMILFIIAGVFAPRLIKDRVIKVVNDARDGYDEKVISMRFVRYGTRAGSFVAAIVCICMTSMLWVDADKVGHLKRIYWGKQMPPGRIIAMPDELGPQARVLMPGFQFEFFIKVTHDIEMLEIMEVPQGQYGFLTAKDGNPLDESTGFMAPAWDSAEEMIDALKFMGWTGDRDTYKGPVGVKGPQLTVLRPGKHRVNRYLFAGLPGKSTAIQTGFVGVVKSNVGPKYEGPPILPAGIESSALSVPIVPKGYRGVWNEVFTPGEYYVNKRAYTVIPIDTRVQTWKYLGGYKRRIINLIIGDDGKIEQQLETIDFPVPKDAADMAIMLRVEGWDVPQDSRVQVQVAPENAPFVVASVGGLEEVENKIITPNYRSIMRNEIAKDVTVTEQVVDEDGNPVFELAIDEEGNEIPGSKGKPEMHTVTRRRKVLDLLYQREELETIVFTKLAPTGKQAGLTVQWVRFGDPGVPPELLIPGKRRQLAKQLEKTYMQEKAAQIARVQTEKERARADQQPVLMESEIGIQVSKNKAKQREEAGIGEKKYYSELAIGQAKQRDVLGAKLTFELALADKILEAAVKNPAIVKMPGVLVQGADGGGLAGAAAILGKSNVNMGMMKGDQPVKK